MTHRIHSRSSRHYLLATILTMAAALDGIEGRQDNDRTCHFLDDRAANLARRATEAAKDLRI